MPRSDTSIGTPSPAVKRAPQGAVAPPELPGRTSPIDPARERRVKALTCTEPLHGLHTNRGRRGWHEFDFYDLGLAAIDAVVDRMAFDTGISRGELESALMSEARRFAQDALDDDTRVEVITELIETLIRPNIGEYTSTSDEIRRRFDFALLTEHEDAEGIYLRATNEAINVLVGGLNTDIESAQVAAEATLEHLIRRRRLDDAARPAREAKIRSVQYAAFIKSLIDETKRDVRRAGWNEEVPKRLTEIREHLRDRMSTEERLLAAMQDARDSAARDDLRRQAATLVEIVDDCFTRHQELHTFVLAAIRIYVEEQDRQVFGRAATIGAIDLTDEVFLPVLSAQLGQVDAILTTFAECLLGFGPGPKSVAVVPIRQPRFGHLILSLLRPPPLRDPSGQEIENPEWEAPPVDAYAFANETWGAAESVLEGLDAPIRLSKLLATAEASYGFDVADLIRLRALVATAPDLDAVRPGSSGVLAAAGDETLFRSRWFAGSDVLVGTLSPNDGVYRGTFGAVEPIGNASADHIASGAVTRAGDMGV